VVENLTSAAKKQYSTLKLSVCHLPAFINVRLLTCFLYGVSAGSKPLSKDDGY
jgi:hypothetical protein